MPIVRFIQPDGTERAVTANLGQSVMQVALDNQISGILGDCGGSCSCATCHGYLEGALADRVPRANSAEADMLTCAMDVQPNSRLTCQINVTPELDGLVVRFPKSQT